MTTSTGLADLVAVLRATLEQVADALVQADPNRLLATEPVLAGVAAGLDPAAVSRLDEPTRRRVAEEAHAALATLARCTHLGQNLTGIVTATLATQGRASGYDRLGLEPVQPPSRRFGERR